MSPDTLLLEVPGSAFAEAAAELRAQRGTPNLIIGQMRKRLFGRLDVEVLCRLSAQAPVHVFTARTTAALGDLIARRDLPGAPVAATLVSEVPHGALFLVEFQTFLACALPTTPLESSVVTDLRRAANAPRSDRADHWPPLAELLIVLRNVGVAHDAAELLEDAG